MQFVGRRRWCILLLSSSSSCVWPDYRDLLHLQGLLYRILARRKIWVQLLQLISAVWCFTSNFSCYFLQDIRFLMEDVQTLKPTMFCGVPRVYDRVYAGKNQILAFIFHGSLLVPISIEFTICAWRYLEQDFLWWSTEEYIV